MTPSLTLEEVVLRLYEVKGLKFGNFKVRTGESTPVYIDMRVIWSYPDIVRAVCEHLWETAKKHNLSYDAVCGLPYQGIPLATMVSTTHDIPMLLKRKQPKSYGTRQAMEGHYNRGDRVLILDDVIMTGATFLDDVPFFRDEGLEPVGAVCFFDREQGGIERVKHCTGMDSYVTLTLTKAFEVLIKHGKVTEATRDTTMEYIKANRFDTPEYLKHFAPALESTHINGQTSNGTS